MEIIIGSHVSFNKEKQMLGSALEALSYNASTFMFYTGAPQNTLRVPIDESLIEKALDLMNDNNIDINNIVVHAPYIINLANSKNFDFNISFLKDEIKRVEKFRVNKLVIHPGSHVGLGREVGLKNIIDSLNIIFKEDSNVCVCLETMAGKGTELGSSFEEIKTIIDGIEKKERVGVCLDTCHINDAGYDLNDFSKILDEFEKIIGLEYLKVVHVNDSKNELGTHKDRHANIGYGTIGFDNLISVIYNEKLKGIPFILETPYVNGLPPYKYEIESILKKKFNDKLMDILK